MSKLSGNIVNPGSIRQIIRTALLAGKPTKEIAELVTAAHPNSAAAAKSTKHIAWYRSEMRKAGLLPKVEQTTAPEVEQPQTKGKVKTA